MRRRTSIPTDKTQEKIRKESFFGKFIEKSDGKAGKTIFFSCRNKKAMLYSTENYKNHLRQSDKTEVQHG